MFGLPTNYYCSPSLKLTVQTSFGLAFNLLSYWFLKQIVIKIKIAAEREYRCNDTAVLDYIYISVAVFSILLFNME